MKQTHASVLLISHSNYLRTVSGTERYIFEQARHLRQHGIEALHLFPAGPYPFLGEGPSTYGVNRGEEFCGYLSATQVEAQILREGSRLRCAYVHHLLHWRHSDFQRLAGAISRLGVPSVYFPQDFFACCPGAFLPCFDPDRRTVCAVPTGRQATPFPCFDHFYGDMVRQWRNRFRETFAWVDQIVAPSAFMKQVLGEIYPHFRHKMTVWELLRLVPRGVRPARTNHAGRKLRIAYLGSPVAHKGWDTWTTLCQQRRLQRSYDFYHLGAKEQSAAPVVSVPYSYLDGGPMAAVKLLEEQEIDLVLLWSQVPESYSYTFHEALAAGLPVLTCKRSGNIAFALGRTPHPAGMVFADARELTAFLVNSERVAALLDVPRPRYSLEPTPYTGPWLAELESRLQPAETNPPIRTARLSAPLGSGVPIP